MERSPAIGAVDEHEHGLVNLRKRSGYYVESNEISITKLGDSGSRLGLEDQFPLLHHVITHFRFNSKSNLTAANLEYIYDFTTEKHFNKINPHFYIEV